MDWCYISQYVPLVTALDYTKVWCYNSRSVTGHKLHLSLLHKAVLTDVDRVWYNRSQSVPLVIALSYVSNLHRDKVWCYNSRYLPLGLALGYTCRGRLDLLLQFKVCTLGYCCRLCLQRWTRLGITVHSLYPWYTYRGGQGLVLQVTVCTLGFSSGSQFAYVTTILVFLFLHTISVSCRPEIKQYTKSS